MKFKIVAAGIIAAAGLSFAGSAAADKPLEPGCIGEAVSGQAHDGGGRGVLVSTIAKTGLYGEGAKAYLATNPCGH